MKKYKIVVPKNIRFLSEWKDFLTNIKDSPCILDKKVTGCGFTELCLTNNMNVILCSPRKILLENKESQHIGEVFYFNNSNEKELKYDKDLKISSLESKKELDAEFSNDSFINLTMPEFLSLSTNLNNYYQTCLNNSKPCKILVTYDSFKYVKEALGENINNFLIVVDEFQSIFLDARFKATTELEFITALKGITKVLYASATAIIEDLKQLAEFKDLPYYELDWIKENSLRLKSPVLKIIKLYNQSIQSVICFKVAEYRKGTTESAFLKTDSGIIEIKSREAVFYVNSVKNICSIIRKANLKPEECNILCARTEYNYELVKKAFGLKKTDQLEIGKVPRYGESHKMFTFCTRTVYLGADFYSTNAKTYIFSDANIESMAVDITLDLPQIMGRQRLDINPWKNVAELYFKIPNNKNSQITEENFKKLIDAKMESSNRLISAYNTSSSNDIKLELSKVYERESKAYNYTYNYIAVDKLNNNPIPVLNKLVMLSELRAFKIQSIDYKDRFSLFNTVENTKNFLISGNTDETRGLLKKFDELIYFPDKLKLLATFNYKSNEEFEHVLSQIPIEYSNIIRLLTIDEMNSVSFRKDQCLSKIAIKTSNELIIKIINLFTVNSSYSKNYIKITLQSLYNQLNLKKTAKASDLEEYFELKSCKVKIDNKWEHGFTILKKKN